MTDPQRYPCPACGAGAFQRDVRCMSCGVDLAEANAVAAAAQAERQRRDEGRQRLKQAKAYVAQARVSGKPDGQIMDELLHAGWPDEVIGTLLDIGPEALAIRIPNLMCVVLHTPDDARLAKADIRLAVKQLRLAKKELALETRQVRQHFAATAPPPLGPRMPHGRGSFGKALRGMEAMTRATHAVVKAQHRDQKQAALANIDNEKMKLDTQLLECERALATIDAWCESVRLTDAME